MHSVLQTLLAPNKEIRELALLDLQLICDEYVLETLSG
jgi:hypothetical protein